MSLSWDFSVENRNNFTRGKTTSVRSIRKWQKAIIKGQGSIYNYIKKVIDDAENKTTIKYCTKYYFCAKFIRHFLIGANEKYKFKRIQHDLSKSAITCCWAYKFRQICGGKCCKQKYQYCYVDDDDDSCGCDMLPYGNRHINNCYDDCCNIFEYKISSFGREFDIRWL